MPPGALPGADGERTCEESRLRFPPTLRALSGALQDALQADLASLEGSCQVRLQAMLLIILRFPDLEQEPLVFVLSGVPLCGV